MRRSSLAKSLMPMVPVASARLGRCGGLGLGLLHPGASGAGAAARVSLEASVMASISFGSSGEQGRVRLDGVRLQACNVVQGFDGAQGSLGLRAGSAQPSLERGGKDAEQVQALRAPPPAVRLRRLPAWRSPRACGLVDVLVGLVGQRHGQAQRRGRLVALVGLLRSGPGRPRSAGTWSGRAGHRPACRSLSMKPAQRLARLTNLPTRSALTRATKSRVEGRDRPRHRTTWPRSSLAQRFRLQAHVQIGARHDEGAARLRHLGAVHGQINR